MGLLLQVLQLLLELKVRRLKGQLLQVRQGLKVRRRKRQLLLQVQPLE